MSRCRLFKAVQETLPDSEKIKLIESKEDVAVGVKLLLERDKRDKANEMQIPNRTKR